MTGNRRVLCRDRCPRGSLGSVELRREPQGLTVAIVAFNGPHMLAAAGFAALKIGGPSEPDTQWGPLEGRTFRDRAEGYIARAVAAGATVAYGGSRPAGFDQGWCFEPTLLTGVTNDMGVAQNDIFGPVFCVIPFDSLDEAVALANDSRYGLAGSVFTRDADTARAVARQVRTGVFAINATFPRLTGPFGGMKQSGFGREGGVEGFCELTTTKCIAL